MPNRVRNTLNVMGAKEHMREFLDKAIKWNGNKPSWQLSNTVSEPKPKDALIPYKEYNRDNWYSRNLGTKWDSSTDDGIAEICTLTDTCFEVDFESAWSPPYVWIEKIIGLYPNLNFKLFCTEEMLAYTAVLFNNQEGNLTTEYGEYLYTDQDGRQVNLFDERWLYTDGVKPVQAKKGEQIYLVSTVQDYTTWFEKNKSDDSSVS